jgi:hypothetical protein
MIGMKAQTAGFRKDYQYKLLLVACLVAAIGIISRVVYAGSVIWDKYLGDAVYAAVFYLVLSLLWGEGTIAMKAMVTTAYVLTIEAFQLTGIPAHLNQSDSLIVKTFAYVVLGSAFSWWDMLAYSVGIGGALLADKLCFFGTDDLN